MKEKSIGHTTMYYIESSDALGPRLRSGAVWSFLRSEKLASLYKRSWRHGQGVHHISRKHTNRLIFQQNILCRKVYVYIIDSMCLWYLTPWKTWNPGRNFSRNPPVALATVQLSSPAKVSSYLPFDKPFTSRPSKIIIAQTNRPMKTPGRIFSIIPSCQSD